jgi:hypothetical protein
MKRDIYLVTRQMEDPSGMSGAESLGRRIRKGRLAGRSGEERGIISLCCLLLSYAGALGFAVVFWTVPAYGHSAETWSVLIGSLEEYFAHRGLKEGNC